MTTTTLTAGSTGAARATDATARPKRDPRMRQSRILGALFLAGFLVYGSGSSIVASLLGGADFLVTIGPLTSLLALGAFLMLLNTAVDIAKAVIFVPILERHSRRTALTYLSAILVQVVFLSIGALAVLMIVPLSTQPGAAGATTVGTVLAELNGMAYQIGQMTLGVGATFVCVLLLRTGLVPAWLAWAGLIGYPLHVAGTVAELFGVPIGLYLTMPGFFFELAFPVWLLIKGFRAEPFHGPRMAPATH
ncbi:DUF4386 domain-containing protein [Agrococcus beijingensis]|uniref:DUF4386 domain-containing protein n=1 Tax=Agrococcus beijingensis TaxID=3068634 RepID=UPI002742201F|nr:DUF4386 domain-containing protein [Agrococcus sp. REN33]